MDDSPQNPFPAWGHADGLLSLGAGAPVGDGEAVADRLRIIERLHRYAWSYDERRAQHLRDCFTEDGVWEGRVAGEAAIGPFTGRSELIAWLTGFWPHQRDQRRHMFLNTIVEDQQPESATVLSYLLLLSARDSSVSLETSAFYRLQLRKEGGEWRIAHLFGGFDAPFWPGRLEALSHRARARHGIRTDEREGVA